MTKQEAIQAMMEGKKVTHQYFTSNEWMTSSPDGRLIILEDGVKCFCGEFWHFRQGESWEDGYSLFLTLSPIKNKVYDRPPHKLSFQ